jgi:hypothetical protein
LGSSFQCATDCHNPDALKSLASPPGVQTWMGGSEEHTHLYVTLTFSDHQGAKCWLCQNAIQKGLTHQCKSHESLAPGWTSPTQERNGVLMLFFISVLNRKKFIQNSIHLGNLL